MIAHHPSEFKTVELRHAYVAEDNSDVLLKEMLEGLSGGPGLDQVFSEVLQYCLVGEELRRVIVDEQNVDRIPGHNAPIGEVISAEKPPAAGGGNILANACDQTQSTLRSLEDKSWP